MAIANEDGSIVLSLKISTQKAFQDFKGKIAQIAKEKNGLKVLVEEAKQLQAKIKELEKEYALLLSKEKEFGADPSFNQKLMGIESSIRVAKADLNEYKAAISSLGKQANKSFAGMTKGIKNFGERIAGIIKSALVFSVLYRVMQGVVKLFNNILMSDEEFKQDWEELKAAFYTAAYPIINLIVPAVKWLVGVVRDWAVSVGKIAAALQGKSYAEYVEQAEASKQAADNYADMEKSSKKTADNVKKQLAAFDDIQILSSGSKSEEETTQNAGFQGLKGYDTSGEKNMLSDLMSAIGGALAAVGIILLLHGAVVWGLGFVIAGAAFWGISEIASKQFSEDPILNTLAKITESIGLSLAAVGLILLINGQITWGLAFVAAGAAMWAITEFAVGQFSEDPIVNTLVKIMGIAGTLLAALGIILLVFGQIGWGVSMLSAGASMLVSALALNSGAVVEAIQGPLGIIMGIVGGALLVLGIILVCTGNLLWGIPLIIAGAVGLVTPIALNGGAIAEWISNVWKSVTEFWDKYIAPVFTVEFWCNLAKNCGNGLIAGFEAGVNGIIWLFEGMINFVVDGLNLFLRGVDAVVSAVGNVFGQDWGVATIPKANLGRMSIPRLAQGAVIPPNKEFLAVLGDQKHGTNIEAPLETIVQAFEIALNGRGGQGGGSSEVVLELDGRELGRAVLVWGDKERKRIGTSLVVG